MNTAVKRILAVLMLLHTIAYAADVKTITLYFAKDQYTLTAGEGQKLQALKNADVVFMQGYTDNDGSDAYNIQLSKNRVQAVRRAVSALAPQVRVETEYFGEKDPVSNNAGEAEKTLNRRVTVSYICDPLLRTKVSAQFFEIDNSTEQTIKCKEGTEVVIPAGAFGNQKVLINVSEYYNPLQIFAANLSTQSNGRPIETAGMIHITAEVNGKRVEPQKELTYKFPCKNMSKDFRFFAGERDSSYNMNWVVENAASSVKPANIIKPILTNVDVKEGVVRNFGGLTLTINVTGNRFNEIDSVQNAMAEGFSKNDFITSEGCIINCEVDMRINNEGRIMNITTNYTDLDNSCDREMKNFLWSYLPKRFSANNGETNVKMVFSWKDNNGRLLDKQIVAQNQKAQLNWTRDFDEVPDWSKDGLVADYETDNIVLKSRKMDWVNCDRFMNGALVNYTVKADTNANVRLIMKKYKAYFVNEYWGEMKDNSKQNKIQGKYAFLNIPANEEVVLISTKNVDGKIYLAIENAKTVSGTGSTVFNYKEVSQKELEEAVKNISL